jgi:hypothetical protein
MPYVVTDTATGYVKRWGSTIDCSLDPGFDPSTETNTEVPDLDLLGTLPRTEVKVDGGVLVEMDQAEKDAVEAAVTLPDYKLKRYLEFDAKTNELILQGFEFPPSSGNIFSLTPTAQANLLGTFTAKDNPAFTWPLAWPTKLDDIEYTIPDAATFEMFYLTALGTIRACRDSGTALKEAVRVATSIAEVDAVVDPR